MSKRFADNTSSPFEPSGTKIRPEYQEFADARQGIDDYTAFDLERFKNELMDKFIRDTNDIANENDRAKNDAFSRLEEYERSKIELHERSHVEENERNNIIFTCSEYDPIFLT